ncbi:MAG: type II toxin-antitoxin system VapC family toxin [Solirubrobacterales bacterium]
MRTFYIDASAFVKLFYREPESDALRALTSDAGGVRAIASDLLAIEARRVARRLGGRSPRDVERELAGVTLVRITEGLRDVAGSVGPPTLRSLDAIHLATAFELRDWLDALLTYDRNLADAGRAVGLEVITPR